MNSIQLEAAYTRGELDATALREVRTALLEADVSLPVEAGDVFLRATSIAPGRHHGHDLANARANEYLGSARQRLVIADLVRCGYVRQVRADGQVLNHRHWPEQGI